MRRKRGFYLILVWPIIATALSYLTHATFFGTTVWFYIVPGVILSFLLPGQVVKSAGIAFTGTLLGLIFDYSAEMTSTWTFPQSYLSWRIFSVTPVEVALWFFAWVYFIVMFYEYFLEKDRRKEKTKSLERRLLIAFVMLFAGVGLLVMRHPGFVAVPYTYLVFGTVFAFLPALVMSWYHPTLRSKFLVVLAYFIYLSVLYELVGLKLDVWTWPADSQVIGWVSLFGYKFPFEEFFFWMACGPLGILGLYEFFDDDRK